MNSQLAALSDALHGVDHHHDCTNDDDDDYYDKGSAKKNNQSFLNITRSFFLLNLKNC